MATQKNASDKSAASTKRPRDIPSSAPESGTEREDPNASQQERRMPQQRPARGTAQQRQERADDRDFPPMNE